MTFIVGVIQHAYQKEPACFSEQQNKIRMWWMVHSEGVHCQNMQALLVELLLQRGPKVIATGLNYSGEDNTTQEQGEDWMAAGIKKIQAFNVYMLQFN